MTIIGSMDDISLGIVGLGYVGLPLAVEFGKKLKTIGFDISTQRIEALCAGHDATREVSGDMLRDARHLSFTSEAERLATCNVFVVTVPTPIDDYKRPDFRPLEMASKTIGAQMNKGAIVIYESTVYPGATEEVCVPLLEEASGLTFNQDFFVGYSPERINPGDMKHRLIDIVKVT